MQRSSSASSHALARWLAPASHDAERSVDVVRFLLAIVLVTHPAHALLDHADVDALAQGLAAHGVPLAHAAAWTAVFVQLAAAIALAIPRFVVAGAAASIAVVGGGAALLYAPRWFVVGGFSEDGHPGMELNALIVALLGAVLWAYARRRAGPVAAAAAARTAVEILRVAPALSLLVHGISPYFDIPGMHAWGTAMSAAGWPCGVALVWSIKGIELASSVLRLSRRFVVPACLGHLSYLVPGVWLEHPGWFDVGPGANGAEFSVLLIVSTAACAMAFWPRRGEAPAAVPANAS